MMANGNNFGEKKTKMDKLMGDTTFSWFLGSVNTILALF